MDQNRKWNFPSNANQLLVLFSGGLKDERFDETKF